MCTVRTYNYTIRLGMMGDGDHRPRFAQNFCVFLMMCPQTTGGAIANNGGDMFFYGGSLFYDNFAENSGDGGYGGAIYNAFGGNIV